MRNTVVVCSLSLVLWLLVPVADASAAPDRLAKADESLALAAAPKAPEVAPAVKPGDEVKVPKDKPKRSKKNPNDDKDEDPDDGNAGGGNDDKTLPNDGPERD